VGVVGGRVVTGVTVTVGWVTVVGGGGVGCAVGDLSLCGPRAGVGVGIKILAL
jgi:hypothetical protein